MKITYTKDIAVNKAEWSDNVNESSKDVRAGFILLPLALHKYEHYRSLGHGR